MSRNNRIYDEDHYDCILDEKLMNKVQSRGMLGTIGHHDKRVDDEDLANGTVSHIVTDLRIVEEADGTRNLYGKLEIMDTPAGNLLKTYYEHGVPLYVSSRGAGKLLNVPNESYKRVDKNNYFLETFDIVKDPGFLQAKPNYVKEGLEEPKTDNDNNIIGEDNMAKKQTVPAIDAEMDSQELINKLLNPLKEQLAELTDAVKLLSEKVLDAEEVTETEEVKENIEATEEVVEEIKEEATACEEPKKETEDDESEKKADVAESVEEVQEAEVKESQEEVVEEKCEDDKEEDKAEEKCDEAVEETEEVVAEAEVKKETEDNESEKKADVAESVEETVEEAKACDCGKEDCPECGKKEAEECDEAKKDEEAEKLEADAEVDDAKADKLEKDAKKDEEEIEEAKAEDKEELEADEKEDDAKAEELKADAEEDREDAEEVKEGCEEADKKEDEKEECDESSDNEAVMNDLIKMVSEASARCKATVEKYEAVCKELNAYKLAEELAITIDEAKEKLETKSYEEIKEEASQKVEETVEEVVEEKVEEPVVESKKATKPVFSRFAGLNESKKSGKKGFSIFG